MKFKLSFLILIVSSLFINAQDIDMLYENNNLPNIYETNWGNSVFYSVFVQSFYDTNNDGIGDIPGLTKKLDYFKSLGIDVIWLLPIHPSPTYHKYDIVDYKAIHPDYGTLEDFEIFVKKTHEKNIKVIIDFVVNHTSDQHEWFKRALNGNSEFIDYYVWTDDTAIINKEPNHWHAPKTKCKALKNKKYYDFFWHEMPDLNFDNPKVREEIKQIGAYWLKTINVDGFRLDAIRFIYGEKEKEKNYEWWKEFRSAMQIVKPDFYMVAEIWGEDTVVAPFLKNGVHAGFNFDVSFSIIKSIKDEFDVGIVDIINKSNLLYKKTAPNYCDAVFLTNHDQNRVMSEFKGNHDKAKLAASILFTIPGAPFIYYGEEIGMLGKKPDENIREPMLWNLEGKDTGQTKWRKPKYSTPEKVPPLVFQKRQENSMFSHYKKLINLYKHSDILLNGSIEKVDLNSNELITYTRNYNKQKLIIIHNISEKSKVTELPMEFLFYNKLLFSSNGKLAKMGHKIVLEPFSSVVLGQ